MADKIEGYLEVGCNEQNEIIVNLPNDMTGHIVFSPNQAQHLANSLLKHAWEAQRKIREDVEKAGREAAANIPVDRKAQTLTDGSPVTPDHREIDPKTGMQKAYVVLSVEERARGFVRPVRRTYLHKSCDTTTTMGLALAETYARDPGFYGGTFCVHCREHFPVAEFVWEGSTEIVGT